jgi:hypothetical protein
MTEGGVVGAPPRPWVAGGDGAGRLGGSQELTVVCRVGGGLTPRGSIVRYHRVEEEGVVRYLTRNGSRGVPIKKPWKRRH